MKRFVLALFVLFGAAIGGQQLAAEIVSANTTKRVICQSNACEEIRTQLVAQGMAPSEAMEVIQHMPADEITYFGADAERTQPGGDAGGFLIFVLVVVLLIVLIVYLVNRT